jgi:predicted phosphoribosyltransferase
VVRTAPQEYVKKSPEAVKVKTETAKDFSQMSKEEITELLKNSEVRLAKRSN